MKFINEYGDEVDDLLGIDGFLEYFSKRIADSRFRVFGLTGEWGIGKTSFIKMWEGTLVQKEYIHIDAFSRDYEGNAFLVLLEAVIEGLKNRGKSKEELREAVQFSKDFFINALKVTGKYVAAGVLKKATGSDDLTGLISGYFDTYFEDLLEKSMKDTSYYEKLKNAIERLTKDLEKPIYIVIDDLDRCRPVFALEILEKAKHLFNCNNIIFILIYSNEIMKRIIEKEYGLVNNGERYLKKVIDREIAFTFDADMSKWITYEISRIDGRYRSSFLYEFIKGNSHGLVNIKNEYRLSIRDIQKIIDLVATHQFPASSEEECSSIVAGVTAKVVDPSEFSEMIKYGNENGNFASNAPRHYVYDRIYSRFINRAGKPNESPDYQMFIRIFCGRQ